MVQKDLKPIKQIGRHPQVLPKGKNTNNMKTAVLQHSVEHENPENEKGQDQLR